MGGVLSICAGTVVDLVVDSVAVFVTVVSDG